MITSLFGASGTVGQTLAPLLAAENTRFRVVGRSEERLRREFSRFDPLVEYCVADLSDPNGAAAAAAGADRIFYLVGVPYPQFNLHPKLTRVALEAAATAGVRHFVLLGTVYPYGLPQTERVDEAHPRTPNTFKGRMRREQEDLVLAAHGNGGMQTAILRPPDFYGPTSELSFARAIFDAALKGGTANIIGPIDTPHEFIFVPDVAAALLALSQKEDAYGQAWNLASVGAITTREFAEMVFQAASRPVKIRVAGKLLLRVAGLFSPMMREIAEMNYLWTSPVILDDSRLRSLIPELKKTRHEDGIRKTLEIMKRQAPSAAR